MVTEARETSTLIGSKYDTQLGGYRTNISKDQLKDAPKFGSNASWNWGDPNRVRSINDYYNVPMVG